MTKGRVAAAAISAALVATVIGAGIWINRALPTELLQETSASGVTIEDRHGVVLRTTRSNDGSHERWIAFEQIDADVINAFVAVEDRRFWDHQGVDVRGAVRASISNVAAGHVVSGASTITMQLVRLMRPTRRNWSGKLLQAAWALRIERHLTKQQILEQYLNRIQLGQATAGVGAASALYFGASASSVSIAQAATLAGLAHAPSRENPLVNPKSSRTRRAFALRRMQALGYASADDIARSKDEPLSASTRAPSFLAPHFTTRVLSWRYEDSARSSRVVHTSLDAELQTAVEAEVRYTVSVLRERGVEQAAAVVVDNNTGEVLAWVGSPDFWSASDGQTDLVISQRQPGSALKPFLYGLALDRGFTAASILPDIPKGYATTTGSYSPRNYDRRFRGPVRAREALASSYNVPAVELASRIGVSNLLHTLRLAGFESLQRDADYYGLGLALGNGDVTLIELANGYRALASGGEWRPWTWRLSPNNARQAGESRRIISPVASAILLDMMSDPIARIPGFGTNTPFDFPFRVAVKTGTSRHFTDNWAIGATRAFTVAVWAGNFNGRPMQGVSGVTGAGPLLHRVVMQVAKRVSPGELVTPAQAGAVALPVCRLSGLRATKDCARLTEWFLSGSEPSATDDWERDGRTMLPEEFAEWSHQSGKFERSAVVSLSPLERRDQPMSLAEPAPQVSRGKLKFRIMSPSNGDRYAIPAGVESRYATIPLRIGGSSAQKVRWLIDGAPYNGSRWPLVVGSHRFTAISPQGDSAEVRITVD